MPYAPSEFRRDSIKLNINTISSKLFFSENQHPNSNDSLKINNNRFEKPFFSNISQVSELIKRPNS